MQWNIRSVIFVISALLLALSNKRPNTSNNEGHAGKDEATSADHRQEPTTEMLHAEWAALRGTIREIHESEKRHQKAERDLGAAQLRTAQGLNRVTFAGAIFGALAP
jgi:hypothetical protein